MEKYFKPTEDEDKQSGFSRSAGGIGIWMLHLIKLWFLVYSASHGINAGLEYAGDGILSQAAQVMGVVSIEAFLLGVYLVYVNQRLDQGRQTIGAGIFYSIGFVMACVGIVADSQMNAGVEVSGLLQAYLQWGLPVAPPLMALGAITIHVLDADTILGIKRAETRRNASEAKFEASLAKEKADLDEDMTTAQLQIMSRNAILGELHNVFDSQEFKDAVKQTAIQRAPHFFEQAGIIIGHSDLLPLGNGADRSSDVNKNGRHNEPAPNA